MEFDKEKSQSGGQERVEKGQAKNGIITIPGEGGQLTQEQQAIIEKFDKESSTRTLGKGAVAKFFYWACIAVSLYDGLLLLGELAAPPKTSRSPMQPAYIDL